jgi:hypothetical protein
VEDRTGYSTIVHLGGRATPKSDLPEFVGSGIKNNNSIVQNTQSFTFLIKYISFDYERTSFEILKLIFCEYKFSSKRNGF